MATRKKRNMQGGVFKFFVTLPSYLFFFSSLILFPQSVLAQLEQSLPPTNSSRDLARHVLGLQLYAKLCAECHGAKGEAPAEIRALLKPAPSDLRAENYRYGSSEKEIAQTIRLGRGVNMFRFDNRLSAEQIDALAKYVRTLRLTSTP